MQRKTLARYGFSTENLLIEVKTVCGAILHTIESIVARLYREKKRKIGDIRGFPWESPPRKYLEGDSRRG